MRFQTEITPLTSTPNNNQYRIDQAMSEGKKTLPKLQSWFDVEYNEKSVELVGDIEVPTSSIEKIKWYGDSPTLGKPQRVELDLNAYSFNGNTGISKKVVRIIK